MPSCGQVGRGMWWVACSSQCTPAIMGHHNHSTQWQHNHRTISWRIRGNLQTISATWRSRLRPPRLPSLCAAGREEPNYPDEGVAGKGPAAPPGMLPASPETGSALPGEDVRRRPEGAAWFRWRASAGLLRGKRGASSRCQIGPDLQDKVEQMHSLSSLIFPVIFRLLWGFVCFAVRLHVKLKKSDDKHCFSFPPTPRHSPSQLLNMPRSWKCWPRFEREDNIRVKVL